jgi:iron complex transport system ATP-binding protein
MTPVLEGRGIRFAYEPDPLVLCDVDVHVHGGEFTTIVGPNGSGKSTLLRIVSGHLTPIAGDVKLGGRALGEVSREDRARSLAFMPQAVNPAFSLTVMEVVCLGRFPHAGVFQRLTAHDYEVAERCLRDAEALDFRDRAFSTLSGGERQRVLLASILAQEPELLLLDEPTSALDLHHEAEFFSLMRGLARDGYGVLVVTHNLNVAAQFSDNVLLLARDHGVVAYGTPGDVLTETQLSKAYGASIRVSTHPLTGTPLVSADVSRGGG